MNPDPFALRSTRLAAMHARLAKHFDDFCRRAKVILDEGTVPGVKYVATSADRRGFEVVCADVHLRFDFEASAINGLPSAKLVVRRAQLAEDLRTLWPRLYEVPFDVYGHVTDEAGEASGDVALGDAGSGDFQVLLSVIGGALSGKASPEWNPPTTEP